MDKEDKMRKTITKVVLIICAVSVALGIALCASGVVMGADVEKALRGIGINVETRIEPNNMYDDYNDDINDFEMKAYSINGNRYVCTDGKDNFYIFNVNKGSV